METITTKTKTIIKIFDFRSIKLFYHKTERWQNYRNFLTINLCYKNKKCYDSIMLDKKKIKEKLEAERDVLLEQMAGMGKLNKETDEWEAIPEELNNPESDQNDMADRFEDFEERSSMIRTLEPRLNNILRALKGINRESFGRCEICKKEIEIARLEANPAARTCKKHLEN